VTPSASRSASGRFVIPARRMVSAVITPTAVAASAIGSVCREAETTAMRDNSSIDRRFSAWVSD
jgi:hypothetical protein